MESLNNFQTGLLVISLMLLVALVGLAISAFGIVTSRQLFEDISLQLDNTLSLAAESLDTVTETLLLTKTTVSQVEDSLETVGETAAFPFISVYPDLLRDTHPNLDPYPLPDSGRCRTGHICWFSHGGSYGKSSGPE